MAGRVFAEGAGPCRCGVRSKVCGLESAARPAVAPQQRRGCGSPVVDESHRTAVGESDRLILHTSFLTQIACGPRGRWCVFAQGAYPYLVRLVSLLPSATEIVYSLGLGEDLVGVTFECDEPPEARSEKTIVVGGRDTRGMTPGEIDSYVRAQLAAGADLSAFPSRALADLQPDLILPHDLCRVCALPSGQVEDALGYLGCQADVLSLDPHSLDDVLDSILAVGRRTGVPDPAARVGDDLRGPLPGTPPARAGRPRPAPAAVE